jgi:hypothetical protein
LRVSSRSGFRSCFSCTRWSFWLALAVRRRVRRRPGWPPDVRTRTGPPLT